MIARAEMVAKLSAIGLTKKYKPYWDGDAEAGCIGLETRKFSITDGELCGSKIDLADDSVVRVWTSQKKKANDIAKSNGFRVRLLDGEAELYIPVSRADEFLHGLGAKVKMNRSYTPEQLAAVKERFAKVKAGKKVALAPAP